MTRPATPYSPETKALRTVVRTRDDLVEARTPRPTSSPPCWMRTGRAPKRSSVFADLESPITLAFLTRYPTPAAAAKLGEKRMAAFCTKHGYTGRRTAGAGGRAVTAATAHPTPSNRTSPG